MAAKKKAKVHPELEAKRRARADKRRAQPDEKAPQTGLRPKHRFEIYAHVRKSAARMYTVTKGDARWRLLLAGKQGGEDLRGTYVRIDPLDAPKDEADRVVASAREFGAIVVRLPHRRGRVVTDASVTAAPDEPLPDVRSVVVDLLKDSGRALEHAERIMSAEGL